jgi:hypothetical protein
VSTGARIGRAAGKLAKKWVPAAGKVAASQTERLSKEWVPAAKHSKAFVKHVVPAAVKPLHVLLHEVLGFVFLVFAGLGVWKILRSPGPMPPVKLLFVSFLVVVLAGYGISSVLKARRIGKS